MNSKADLHIHTNHSDGTASPRQVLEYVAKHTDLRVIAITDHDCIEGALEAARLGPEFGIDVIVGEEVSTADGHLLALFINKHLPKGRPVAETVQAIHAQGGLAIAPHPFDGSVPSLGRVHHPLDLAKLQLDGLEGFNASVFWSLRDCNRKAQTVAQTLKLAITGGSDSHGPNSIGKGYTLFNSTSAKASASDVYRAIQTRQTTCAGEYWTLADHARMLLGSIRRVGLVQSVYWAAVNAGQMA